MAPPFTFVNVSNAPGLGPKEAKQMRAHITKTNFAKRRQRLAKEKQDYRTTQSSKDPRLLIFDEQRRLMQKWVEAALDPGSDSLLTSMADPIFSPIGYLLHDFRPLIFPAGTGAPGSVREKEWINLLESEPALVEASVAIALRHCPKHRNTWGPREAAIRKGRAIKLINQRLDTPAGLTDGVLSAVFTLTYAEVSGPQSKPLAFTDCCLFQLLGSDAEARSVHIQGLAQMVRVRRSSGNNTIPSWFCDFIL
ncbi:hypothetical protein NW762_009347 [Fusarium torreyae]|uniref:Uncharacterized protein n=1 Tax=Fusarium torreyae TaxID=1237075 RepID=A0A9W8VC65_9HYPO|nr:hypothetical protein NW762_009347 [Fusarium torreyae]